MPFYDQNADGSWVLGTPKSSLRLVQLGPRDVDPDELPPWKDILVSPTLFTCSDGFGWSDSVGVQPRPDSVVPAGTQTDLASIPTFLWGLIPSYGRHTIPAVLHDVRCDRAKELATTSRWRGAHERRAADHQFLRTLKRHASMAPVSRWIVWSAVRLFGFFWLGLLVVLGVLAALLHYASATFTNISSDLTGVTIWPWLSLLDVIPKGIAAVLARLADLLAPDATFRPVMIVVAALALAAALFRSVESSSDAGPAFSPVAFGSLVLATVVAGLTLPPLLALAVVTLVTRVVLWVLDLASALVERLLLTLGIGAADDRADPPDLPAFPGFFPQP